MLDELQMLKQLGDALPFGVCVVDLGRRIRYWNAAAEQITGHWRQEVMGRSCCDELIVDCGSQEPNSVPRADAGQQEKNPTLRLAQDGAPDQAPTLGSAQDEASVKAPTLSSTQDGAPVSSDAGLAAGRNDDRAEAERQRGCCPPGRCPHFTSIGPDGLNHDRPTKVRRFCLRHKEGYSLPVLMRSLPLRCEDGLIAAWAEIFQEEHAPREDCGGLEQPGLLHPALGIPSAAATQDELRLRLSEGGANLAIFVVAIRDVSRLVGKYGDPMVRAAERTLAHTLAHLLTVPYYLGCWTGDRLLALVADCHPLVFAQIQRQLARITSLELTWWGDRIALAVEVSATLLAQPITTPDEIEALIDHLAAAPATGESASGEMR